MRIFLSIFIIMILGLPSFVSMAREIGLEETFFNANQAYKEGLFQDAAEGYEELIRAGQRSGHVSFNLGNAYFRLEKLGKAILNYERARVLIPRDADLRFNLNHARDKVIDSIEEDPGFLHTAFFWNSSLNLKELFYGFAALNILFWAFLLIRLLNKSEWSYYASIIFFIFWLISGASFGMKYCWEIMDERGVIIEKEVEIMAGPDERDTVLFRLHEGTIVNVERTEESWSLVSLPGEKRGWIISKNMEMISMMNT